MVSYSVYAYPWNFSARNVQRRVDEILSLGVQGISLAVSYHAGKFIHPRSSNRRVYFPEDGVIYFRPRARYGRLQPVPSQQLAREDVLEYLAETDGLLLNAWTVLFHNSRFGLQYPDVTAKNAFGNGYVYSLCPAHPEVREYALTLCRDLTEHYSISNLLLETPGYLGYSHGYHHEFAQVPPDSWLEAWLGLCFCKCCITGARRAGINSPALQKQVTTIIDDYLGSAGSSPVRTALDWLLHDAETNEELGAFLTWRCEIVASLIRDIRAQVRSEVNIRVITTTQASHRTSVLEGHDLPLLHKTADGLELPLYQPSVAATVAEAEYVMRKVGGVKRLSAILRPGWPDVQNEEQVMETIDCVRKSGFRDISFYNYDMLLPRHLQWLGKALAYHTQTGDG